VEMTSLIDTLIGLMVAGVAWWANAMSR